MKRTPFFSLVVKNSLPSRAKSVRRSVTCPAVVQDCSIAISQPCGKPGGSCNTVACAGKTRTKKLLTSNHIFIGAPRYEWLLLAYRLPFVYAIRECEIRPQNPTCCSQIGCYVSNSY